MIKFRVPVWHRSRVVPLLVLVTVCASAGGFAIWHSHRAAMEKRLMEISTNSPRVAPDLARFAQEIADPVFAEKCAGCHGANMKGNVATGAPNLIDANWLYRSGMFDIERAMLYGLRSGYAKGIDVTEMPAFGQRGQLDSAEIAEVTQFVLQLSGRPFDDNAAQAGAPLFGKFCVDCHAPDGQGNADYGAPDLTSNHWNYGGSPAQIAASVYYGRHGVMPAFYGKLSPLQTRALAVTFYAHSHK